MAVILVVPMCLLCSITGITLARMEVNIFTQIGFVVLVGLASKNAILIVEFAKQQEESGKSRRDAILEASRLRLRPILMTSLAFILGVVPLVRAFGAGARNAGARVGLGRVRRYAGRDDLRSVSDARVLLCDPSVWPIKTCCGKRVGRQRQKPKMGPHPDQKSHTEWRHLANVHE